MNDIALLIYQIIRVKLSNNNVFLILYIIQDLTYYQKLQLHRSGLQSNHFLFKYSNMISNIIAYIYHVYQHNKKKIDNRTLQIR
jgi:hypothetical protein